MPELYQTEPSGIYTQWNAAVIGRSSKTVTDFLQTHYPAAGPSELADRPALTLAIRALLEVVQTGASSMDVVVMTGHGQVHVRSHVLFCRCFTHSRQKPALEEIEQIVKEIEAEKEAEAERKRSRLIATTQARSDMVSTAA